MADDMRDGIEALVHGLGGAGFTTVRLQAGSAKLTLRVPAAERAPAAVPVSAPGPAPAVGGAEAARVLRSPRVGHFYPKAGTKEAPRFKRGDTIEKGEVYGTIEAMHIRYELRSELGGVVDAFLASEGEAVEYGQPLLALLPGR